MRAFCALTQRPGAEVFHGGFIRTAAKVPSLAVWRRDHGQPGMPSRARMSRVQGQASIQRCDEPRDQQGRRIRHAV